MRHIFLLRLCPLYFLCLLCLSISGCASAPFLAPPVAWQGPGVLIRMTVWLGYKEESLPLQSIVRLSQDQQQLGLILLHGSSVGHCQLQGTVALCTASSTRLAPVLNSVGQGSAQWLHHLAPHGIDSVPPQELPAHMSFSEERITDATGRITWPKHIYIQDEARALTLHYIITEVILL